MIRSMTGFASLTRESELGTVGVTIRSGNHRYLDIQVRLPSMMASLEGALRGVIQRYVARGRVEVGVSVQLKNGLPVDIDLNLAVVRCLAEAVERARGEGLVDGRLQPGDLLRLPQALIVREAAQDANGLVAERLGPFVEAAVVDTLASLNIMRAREGGHLAADLAARRHNVSRLLVEIQRTASEGRIDIERRLTARIQDLRLNVDLDQATLAQEIVRLAARSDISEEMVRLESHLAQWDRLVAGEEACGRKLDFLLQEMNREVNTIGAKADGAAVTPLVVEAKAELERLREQVQNVE